MDDLSSKNGKGWATRNHRSIMIAEGRVRLWAFIGTGTAAQTASASSKPLPVFKPETLELRENSEDRFGSFIGRYIHRDAVVRSVIADMHIDTLRAAVGNADDVVKHLPVDNLGPGRTEEAKARFSSRTLVNLVEVVGSEYRSAGRRRDLRRDQITAAQEKKAERRREKTALVGNPLLHDVAIAV
jgi:hypothetical protein